MWEKYRFWLELIVAAISVIGAAVAASSYFATRAISQYRLEETVSEVKKAVLGKESTLQAIQRQSGQTQDGLHRLVANLGSYGANPTTRGFPEGTYSNVWLESLCAEGEYVTGVRVRYGGTCQTKCKDDGGTVRDIQVECRKLHTD